MEPIAPLAKILAEANGIEWQSLRGSGPGGQIVEEDILDYLARVMAGEAEPPATPVDAPPPDWDGEPFPGGAPFDASLLSRAGVESDIVDMVQEQSARPAPVPSAPSVPTFGASPAAQSAPAAPVAPEDEFELDDEFEVEPAPAPAAMPAQPALEPQPAPMPQAAPVTPAFTAPAPAAPNFGLPPVPLVTAGSAPVSPAMVSPMPVSPMPVSPVVPAPPAPTFLAAPVAPAEPASPSVPMPAAPAASAQGFMDAEAAAPAASPAAPQPMVPTPLPPTPPAAPAGGGLGNLLSRLYQGQPGNGPAAPAFAPAPAPVLPTAPQWTGATSGAPVMEEAPEMAPVAEAPVPAPGFASLSHEAAAPVAPAFPDLQATVPQEAGTEAEPQGPALEAATPEPVELEEAQEAPEGAEAPAQPDPEPEVMAAEPLVSELPVPEALVSEPLPAAAPVLDELPSEGELQAEDFGAPSAPQPLEPQPLAEVPGSTQEEQEEEEAAPESAEPQTQATPTPTTQPQPDPEQAAPPAVVPVPMPVQSSGTPEAAPSADRTPAPTAGTGVYLRRSARVEALADLRAQLAEVLEREVPLGLLVARAAQRSASELGSLDADAVALDHADRPRPLPAQSSLREGLSALDGEFEGTPALLVVDAGALDLDDLHYPHTLTLSVGRSEDGRAALSLQGDVDPQQGARFLAAVAQTLEKPVALLV